MSVFVIVTTFCGLSVKKQVLKNHFFVVVGVVEIYVWFKEWFNFMFKRKHVKKYLVKNCGSI
jgi:hypothetical protein